MAEASIEQQAKSLGWVPQEEFKGDVERWVDADTFVDKGRHIMPILQKNNDRLQSELATVRAQQVRTDAALAKAQAALEDMQEQHTIETQRAVDAARKELKVQLAQASENGEHAMVAELTDQLSQMPVEVPKHVKEAVAETPNPAALPPEFIAWNEANKWFGSDPVKTALANGIGTKLRSDPANVGLQGRPFWDAVSAEVDRIMNPKTEESPNPDDKVAGARQSGGTGEKGSRYSDLPADAKAACDADIRVKVGEGKRYKTPAEWRAKYAELYFGMEY